MSGAITPICLPEISKSLSTGLAEGGGMETARSLVLVTADHGFLFQETPPGQTDKNTLASKPEGTLLAKKRYLLGRNLPLNDKAYRGSTAVTAGADGENRSARNRLRKK